MAGEYLSRGINKLFSDNPNLHFDTKRALHVRNLAYADDIIIFCKGLKTGVEKIRNFMKHYEKVSGQKHNYEKRNLYVGRWGNSERLHKITGFNIKDFPIFYLGAPIFTGKKKITMFLPLLENIKAKCTGWSLNILSHGGRWVIIQCVGFYGSLLVTSDKATFSILQGNLQNDC